MTANDVAIENALRMKNTIKYITNAIERNDLEMADNWARHLEMQVIAFRHGLAFVAANQEKAGA